MHGSRVLCRISEERRKRLQDLEKELMSYKKRIREIKTMEQENRRLQEKALKLNVELTVRLLFIGRCTVWRCLDFILYLEKLVKTSLM